MAKKPLPPVMLPVVRVERGPDVPPGEVDRTNVVDIDAFRHRRERVAEERCDPPADT